MTLRLRKGDLARVVALEKAHPKDFMHEPYGIIVYTDAEHRAITEEWLRTALEEDLDVTRVPPRKEYVNMPEGEIVQVVRARSAVPHTLTRVHGWTLVLSTVLGRQVYIHRKHLQPVAAATTEQESEST